MKNLTFEVFSMSYDPYNEVLTLSHFSPQRGKTFTRTTLRFGIIDIGENSRMFQNRVEVLRCSRITYHLKPGAMVLAHWVA